MTASPAARELEEIELRLLTEGVRRRYGYDLANFAPALVRRRVEGALRAEGLSTLSAFQERILRDGEFLERFVGTLATDYRGLFRDAALYALLREEVIPALRTWPSVRVWVPGCGAGPEAYAAAVLLEEEGLYERSRIYATDMGAGEVERAREGAYPAASARRWAETHRAAGGRRPLEEYWRAEGGRVAFSQALRRRMVFAQHCLATDASINEFHLILCRGAAGVWDEGLRGRIQGLLDQSLAISGYLVLGAREKPYGPLAGRFAPVTAGKARVYRKVA